MKSKTLDEKTSATVVMTALRKEAAPLIKKTKALSIKSKDSFEIAAANVKQLKALAKIATEKKQSLTDPLKKVIDGINELFSPFLNEIKELETAAKAEMLQYNVKANAQVQKLESNFGTESGIKKVSTLLDKTASISVTSNVRKTWQAIEVDATKTPRKFLVPDESAIKEALKNGERVAGWEWKQVESIAI